MKVKHLFFSIIAAAFLTSAMGVDNTVKVGNKAPEIETISGSSVVENTLTDGKAKLVSFWSPKKPASRIANRQLGNKYGDNSGNVEFISICTDSDETLMNEILKLDGINRDNNFSYSEISPRVFKDYDVENNPKAFLISSDGKIEKIIFGA